MSNTLLDFNVQGWHFLRMNPFDPEKDSIHSNIHGCPTPHKPSRYWPALGHDRLTPLYDPIVKLFTRETRVKSRLLQQAELDKSHTVLDVGCGTGTLLLMAKRAIKGMVAVGLDGDGKILGLARKKTRRAMEAHPLIRASSIHIPFLDGTFDRVLSSLMLHHLTPSEKLHTLREMYRTLRPGGELHVADWGRPRGLLMELLALVVRVGDGFERTRDNLDGRLPTLCREAGFEEVSETARFATIMGTMTLYRGKKPEKV